MVVEAEVEGDTTSSGRVVHLLQVLWQQQTVNKERLY